MKEHKNPKVLSEGILWMVLAVDDFGVSHLKLKVFSVFANNYLVCHSLIKYFMRLFYSFIF